MNDRIDTLHGLIDNLTEYLKLTPEQQFRVTAKIKRLIHAEKASVFHRYYLYGQGVPIFEGKGDDAKIVGHEPAADPWLHDILKLKAEQHEEMASNYTDEQLVTWNVGTHVFKQKKPTCFDCLIEAQSYVTIAKGDERKTLCKECAVKSGNWDYED